RSAAAGMTNMPSASIGRSQRPRLIFDTPVASPVGLFSRFRFYQARFRPRAENSGIIGNSRAFLLPHSEICGRARIRSDPIGDVGRAPSCDLGLLGSCASPNGTSRSQNDRPDSPRAGPPRGQDQAMSFEREPNSEPLPGYRLIEPLGNGGFGEV